MTQRVRVEVCKFRRVRVETCKFVCVSELVPKQWRSCFYEAISDNAPFSWGDNNRSMVDVECFLQHCDNRVPDAGATTAGAYREWRKMVARLPNDVYIDLEN